MKLYRIIARKPGAAFVLAEEIKSYKVLSNENKKYYLCENPVIYEDINGGCFSAALKDILTIDNTNNIIKSMGLYKIPVELITA